MADFCGAEPVYLVEFEVEFGGSHRGDFGGFDFVLLWYYAIAGAFYIDGVLYNMAAYH